MNDETLDPELSALLDGELAPERAAELNQRIASDPALSARLAELAAVNEGLRGLTPPAMPSDLRARLQARIELESPAVSQRATSHERGVTRHGVNRQGMNRRRMTWGAPLAAALAAGLVAAWLMLPNSSIDDAQVAIEPESRPMIEVKTVPALEEASDDELAIAFELENLRDLELIQDLDLLEALVAMEDAKAQSKDEKKRG